MSLRWNHDPPNLRPAVVQQSFGIVVWNTTSMWAYHLLKSSSNRTGYRVEVTDANDGLIWSYKTQCMGENLVECILVAVSGLFRGCICHHHVKVSDGVLKSGKKDSITEKIP